MSCAFPARARPSRSRSVRPSRPLPSQAFDIQDAYFQSNGLPVNIVTPKGKPGGAATDGFFDYASIEGQQKLVALDAAIEASPWIEEDSANAWYPMLREWIYECGVEVTFDEGPLANTTCVKRDCSWTPPAWGANTDPQPILMHE